MTEEEAYDVAKSNHCGNCISILSLLERKIVKLRKLDWMIQNERSFIDLKEKHFPQGPNGLEVIGLMVAKTDCSWDKAKQLDNVL